MHEGAMLNLCVGKGLSLPYVYILEASSTVCMYG